MARKKLTQCPGLVDHYKIEFEIKLRELLAGYNCSPKDVIILDRHATSRKGTPVVPEKGTRRPRSLKVYKNRHRGEVVETKGGNDKTLKGGKQSMAVMRSSPGSSSNQLRQSDKPPVWAAFFVQIAIPALTDAPPTDRPLATATQSLRQYQF